VAQAKIVRAPTFLRRLTSKLFNGILPYGGNDCGGYFRNKAKGMDTSRAWRALLGKIIQDSQERQRIAAELGVHPVTLMRWVNAQSNPRAQNLQQLLNALPQYRSVLLELIQKEFTDFTTGMGNNWMETPGIPHEFYMRVLHTCAVIPKEFLFSSVSNLILQQAIEQLDPQRLGMAIIVVRCMPPNSEHKVRSLREIVGRGTPPWERVLEQQAALLGAESLAGHVVISGHLEVNQRLKDNFSLSPGYRGPWEESAAAAPIMRVGLIAGGLLVSSTQPDYFLPHRCTLIQSYAELIALAFAPEDFYSFEQIELGVLPPYEEQRPYFPEFRRRLAEMMMRTARDKLPLNLVQAEQMMWQQIAEEFLYNGSVESSKEASIHNEDKET
jgi:transcriptional regulator with XRE-family HTH domain